MKPAEIADAVVCARISVEEGIQELEKLDYSEDLAREQIFICLGGDNIITTDDEGVRRYLRSGKSVEDIEGLMEDSGRSCTE